MFEEQGNSHTLIPYMWKNYPKAEETVLLFGLEKGLNHFKIRFTKKMLSISWSEKSPGKVKSEIIDEESKYKKANAGLWKFKEEEGSEGTGCYLIGEFNKKAIETLMEKKFEKLGFSMIEIYSDKNDKAIKQTHVSEMWLENFSEEEIKELEKRLQKFFRKEENP